MSKKLFSFIKKRVKDVDLFDRIDKKTEYVEKPIKKRSFRLPLVLSTASIAIVTVSLGVSLMGKDNKKSNFGNLGIATPSDNETSKPDVSSAVVDATTSNNMAEMPGFDEEFTGTPEAPGDTEDYDPSLDDTTTSDISKPTQSSKLLTASEWSDLKNYSYWKDLIDGNIYDGNQEQDTTFLNYYNIVQSRINKIVSTKNMINFKFVTDNNQAIVNAKVSLSSGDKIYYTSFTNAFGNSYLFLPEEFNSDFKITVTYSNINYVFDYSYESLPKDRFIKEVKSGLDVSQFTNLDLCFLVDTTGSMGDEMNYLAKEVNYIIESIDAFEGNYNIQLSFVLYRDDGDAYVSRTFDFNSNIKEGIDFFSKQSANGGGDIPEAIEVGMEEMNKLSWRDDSLKMVFHLFDAGCHTNRTSLVYDQIIKASSKGIKMYPIICSTNEFYVDELIAREEAILTGGSYIYLTNHSGVGNVHSEVTSNHASVTEYLADVVVRLVKENITGEICLPKSITETSLSNYQYTGTNGKYSIKNVYLQEEFIYVDGVFDVNLENLDNVNLMITIDSLDMDKLIYENKVTNRPLYLTSETQLTDLKKEGRLVFEFDKVLYDYLLTGATFTLSSTFGLEKIEGKVNEFTTNFFSNVSVENGQISVGTIE